MPVPCWPTCWRLARRSVTGSCLGCSLATSETRPLLVLWDVDHTLIENGGVSKETYATAFELLTGRRAEHRARTDGRTDPNIVRDLLERHGVEVTPDLLARAPDALATALSSKRERLEDRGYALAGVREVLGSLERMPGVIQTVLTGNVQPNAFIKVETFGLHTYLDFEVGAYGSDDSTRANLVGIARKRAAKKYGVSLDASSTVLVGDTPRDVQAGLTGGAYVVAVASGDSSVDELHAVGADCVLPDLTDTSVAVAAITRPLRG